MKNHWKYVLMLVIACVALAVGCGPGPTPTPTPTPTAEVTPTPTPTPSVTTASLAPSSVDVQPGDEFTIEVNVDPAGKGISGGEISLRFDPAVVTVVSVEAGQLLGAEPLEGIKQIDEGEGTLRYALARLGATAVPTPSGTFARVTFQVAEGAEAGSYSLELESVALADEAFKDVTPVDIHSGEMTVAR